MTRRMTLLAGLTALATSSHAAPINWEETTTAISTPGDVITDGVTAANITYTKDIFPSGTSDHLAAEGAIDFGPGGTVNGVVFANGGGTGDYWTTNGGTSTGDAALDAILNTHDAFGGTEDPWVLTLAGLTPDTNYKIQIIGIHDLRTVGGINNRTTTYQDQDGGAPSPTLTRGAGGSVIGTFTTGPAETSFSIEGRGAADPGAGAVVLRVIPAGQPLLTDLGVTNITTNSAEASATLSGADAELTLFWAETDYGTDLSNWQSNGTANGPDPALTGQVTRSLSGLATDTRYTFRFRAVNTTADPAEEAWSAPLTFATSLTGKAVTDLEALAFSAYEIDLFWTDNFNTETGFVIQRSPAGADTWETVAELPANTEFHTDAHTGLLPATSYEYRILATSTEGASDPSPVASAGTDPATAVETRLLVEFDGTLDGTTYTPAAGEIDTTGTFQASGSPIVATGSATLNPGTPDGSDGFHFDPTTLGSLTTQNWSAEAVVVFEAFGGGQLTIIDVQGDTSLRINNAGTELEAASWNGSVNSTENAGLPPLAVPVHLALVWDAGTGTLTAFVNGNPIGPIQQGAFATPDPSNVSFGYFGRSGYDDRGIDGRLEAVAFQSGTAAIDPATDFLILPAGTSFAEWIGGFPEVGTQNGLDDDPDGDALSNGLEALFGTDPTQWNEGVGPLSTDGTLTTFTHPQADPPITGLTHSYEWSLDLTDWFAGDGVDGPVDGPAVTIPGASAVEGIATITATASEPLPQLYLRVSVNP